MFNEFYHRFILPRNENLCFYPQGIAVSLTDGRADVSQVCAATEGPAGSSQEGGSAVSAQQGVTSVHTAPLQPGPSRQSRSPCSTGWDSDSTWPSH